MGQRLEPLNMNIFIFMLPLDLYILFDFDFILLSSEWQHLHVMMIISLIVGSRFSNYGLSRWH